MHDRRVPPAGETSGLQRARSQPDCSQHRSAPAMARGASRNHRRTGVRRDMTKHLLVTGGCGFIGSNFIRFVLANRDGYRVTNLDALTYSGNLENLSDLEGDDRYEFV